VLKKSVTDECEIMD